MTKSTANYSKRTAAVTPTTPDEQPMFMTWQDGDAQGQARAMYQTSRALERVEPILRSQGSNVYQNISPGNVSVRDGMSRRDYEEFRPGEAIPTTPRGKMKACNHVYKTVGLIRNILDMMSDFSTQGITICHPNERIQNFYREWWRIVKGKSVSERFANYCLRLGVAIPKRSTAKISVPVEDRMKQVTASDEPDIADTDVLKRVTKREIPWKYRFQNPMKLGVLEEELSLFVDNEKLTFTVDIPNKLIGIIKNPKTQKQREIVEQLSPSIREAVKLGQKQILLDPSKTKAFFYKRDDWETWADPITFSILSDINLLQKMKMADLAALDGAISCIRVWKLGNIDAKMMPTETAINRLAQMLMNNVGGGVMDLVWGPGIELLETSTEVHKFLGETKYAPVLTAIYAGMGIPPSMTGATTSGGLNNNYISLKTMTERLQYVRDRLTEFWEEEVRLVQKAMGFRVPATVVYDRMTLTDEGAEKKLLLDMADRDLISFETVIERFGECPEIEQVRLRREKRRRDKGLLPSKAGPYHVAEKDHELRKLITSGGTVTPSEMGIELQPKKPGQLSPAEFKQKSDEKKARVSGGKPKGTPGQGRPKNSKDSRPRKTKTVRPKASVQFLSNLSGIETSQAELAKIVTPIYLKAIKKKTLRELTDEETYAFEQFKFYTLFNLPDGEPVSIETVKQLSKAKLTVPAPVDKLLKKTIALHIKQHGKEPSLDVIRRYQASAIALWKSNDETDSADDSL